MEVSYKNYYIAFLDILGFKEMIINESCDFIYNIFEDIHSKSHTELNFNGVQIDAFDFVQHKILSDSIILFIESSIEDSFVALLDVCARLQYSLARREKPILLRGGITKGNLYFENDIIFGRGLTEAYLLEERLAVFPRIIFTGNTLEDGRTNTKYLFAELDCLNPKYAIDDDGLFYVDYLEYSVEFKIDNLKRYYDSLISRCNEMLNKPIDQGLREKYLWLKRKIEGKINSYPTLNDIYEKEKKEKRSREIDEYNKRFEIYPDHEILEIKPIVTYKKLN